MNETFTILGRTQVRVAGRLQNGRARHLLILGALLAQPGRQIPFRTLIDWAWSEDEQRPQHPQQTFHTYANRIRSLLGKVDASVQLIGQNGTLRLVVDRMLIDYHLFRALIDQARQAKSAGEVGRARDLATEAMDLWIGPPLVELNSAAAANWRRNVMLNQWIPANILLVEQYLALDEADRAIALLDDVQDEFPASASLAKLRIRALRQLDRYHEADDYYIRFRRSLKANAEDDAAAELRKFQDDIRKASLPTSVQVTTVEQSTMDHRPVPFVLPHALSVLAGRDRLLAKLDELASGPDGRLRATVIVLDGPSGVGKTALATHWAHGRHDEHGDGAIFVDLRGFSTGRPVTADAAVDELLQVLGFSVDRIDTASGRAAKLRELLSGRRTVVVLDNVNDTHHILPLLGLLSNSFVLITTRRRLTSLETTYGAHSFTVHRLSVGDAIELISQRVGNRVARARDAVTRLAELCAGLPLALTLVAHHIAPRRDVPLAEFVDRFRDPNVLLALGDEGDGTDSSLRMAFATSYRELRDFEQRIFRLLALHPGPHISVPAAAALTGLPAGECRRGLDALVAAHLLEQRGALDRYAFHDLLKAFAGNLVLAEEAADAQRAATRRMLDFYLHSAHRADRQVFAYRHGPPMPAVPQDVTPMRFDDERAAVEWCRRECACLMAAVDCAVTRGFWSQGWLYPHVLAGTFKRLGLRTEVRYVQERGLVAARADGKAEAEGATLSDMGQLAMECGSVAEARKLFHLAMYIAQRESSGLGIATSHCHMARLDIVDGNVLSGIDHYQESMRMARLGGHVHLEAVINSDMGDVMLARKQYENAMAHYHAALHLHQSKRNLNGQMSVLAKLSSVYLARRVGNDATVALEYAMNALKARATVIDTDIERRARMSYSEVLLVLGRKDEAVEQSGLAVVLARQARAVTDEAVALKLHASALKAAGRRTEAIAALRQCAAIFEDRNDVHQLALVRDRLAELIVSPDRVPTVRDDSDERTVPLSRPAPDIR